MKKTLFISYSTYDIQKVEAINNRLKNHKYFKPLVIISTPEALKPLSAKVQEGIISSDVVVPILSSKSINTQWINQEIGFATALGKIIKPIIERKIIERLKGFIHKQVDLPYLYDESINTYSFQRAFSKLIIDLETELLKSKDSFHLKDSIYSDPMSTKQIGNTLLSETNDGKLGNYKAEYRSLTDEVRKIFDSIQEIVPRQKLLDYETVNARHGDYRIYILVFPKSYYVIRYDENTPLSLDGCIISIQFWTGHIKSLVHTRIVKSTRNKLIDETIFFYHKNNKNKIAWLQKTENKLYTGKEIIAYLITDIRKKFKKK